MNKTKLITLVLSGASDRNIPFNSTVSMLQRVGFELRIRGSHHFLSFPDTFVQLNLQPEKDGRVKAYQVK